MVEQIFCTRWGTWPKNLWTKQIGVTANVEQGENIRASANQEEQQGNETLNNGHDTKRTLPKLEFEERALQRYIIF